VRPLVAIVGRPNVGKSTLFNRVVGEKRAIVLGTPGVTRDRNYGDAAWRGVELSVIDTGGFEPRAEQGVLSHMREHALLAIDEADVVVFVLDAKAGLMPDDQDVIDLLRRGNRPVLFAVNKVDGPGQEGLASEFYSIGAEQIFPVSAEHGRGIGRLLDAVVEALPESSSSEPIEEDVTRVALIGRPNAGKSTLANRLLGEQRMIVDAVPGTTRDAIDSMLEVDGRRYALIDTAGLRRSRRIDRRSPEGYGVVRTLRAVARCHVAVALIDAQDGVTDQDARIIGLADEKGRALVIGVNKWDAVEKGPRSAQAFQEQLRLKLPFAAYAPVLFLSGLTGQRVHRLLGLVDRVRAAHLLRVGTGPLNRWLEATAAAHQPAVVRGRRLRFYFATQVAVGPPTVMISCNEPQGLHFSYQRYLVNHFREAFSLEGTPIRLVFRGKKRRDEDERA